MQIVDARAFGKTLNAAFDAGYVEYVEGTTVPNPVSYATVVDKVIQNATVAG